LYKGATRHLKLLNVAVLSMLLCNTFNDWRTKLRALRQETVQYFKWQWTRL